MSAEEPKVKVNTAVALRSRSPQTAAELARSGSIRFYSILFYSG